MNYARAIELAFADAIRNGAELLPGVQVRSFQTLSDETELGKDGNREFPVIDIRAVPPSVDENQTTCYCDCSILVGTHGEDDRLHALLSALYGSVQEVLDTLYSQFRANTGDALTAFRSKVEAEVGESFLFGGFSWPGGMAPSDAGNANMIGQTMRVHFARTW